MTFQAQSEDHRALEQPRVHGPVRTVAAFAAVHAHRHVFEYEWTPLVDVAFQAGFFIGLRLLGIARPIGHTPSGRGGAVGVMAIGALHEPFVHPVFERHGELRAHVGMAGVTQIYLLLRQQKFRSRGLVNGVAIGAHHVFIGVRAAANVGAGKRLGVAAQAGVENLRRRQLRERNDAGFTAVRIYVRLPRPVAAFAPRVFRRFLA